MKKIEYGQFFTKDSVWLKPQIINFISKANCKIIYDPFAGQGDLFSAIETLMGRYEFVGLDIDKDLAWTFNDSLDYIPPLKGALVVTNPPYIAKQSASRKKIDLKKYFSKSTYDDVYLIALDKILDSQDKAVAIIPESFINSIYKRKSRLTSITVLEENPFEDTENPVCVVCFDENEKPFSNIQIYKNSELVLSLEQLNEIRLEPKNDLKIVFNEIDGWLAIRAIDSTNDKKRIEFTVKEKINYDWENKIKESSRHITLVKIEIPFELREDYIRECNNILNNLREKSQDLLLTPFKGNTKQGVRRRRLDFRLARAIMEKAYHRVVKKDDNEQLKLF